MTKLRSLARGRECQVRSPVCNFNPETTVLAHFRLSGTCGVGMKPPDVLGAWACSACHDLIDRRIFVGHDEREVKFWHMQGVMRTIAALHKEGKIKI